MHHVLVATPSYDNKITSDYMASVLQYLSLTDKNISYLISPNDALVTRARNDLFTSFYENINKKDLTHILFQDSDIFMQGFGLEKMLSYDVDVIGQAVPLKRSHSQYGIPCAVANVYNKLDSFLYQSEYLGSGIMILSKRAVMDLVEYCEDHSQWYYDPAHRRKIYDVFSVGVDKNKIYQSEDWYICDLLRKIGYDIHVDSSANTSHMDIKRPTMFMNEQSLNRKYESELPIEQRENFWTPNDWVDITVPQEFYT